MTTQLMFGFAALTAPRPRLPVWPPMPLRAALTPPALPARRARRGATPPAPAPAPSFQVVYLVGCGSAKQRRRSRARDLYTGSLFRACRQHAEQNGSTWRILSAAFGTLRPEKVIDPYDRRLPRNGAELAAWAINAATGLTSDPELRGGFRVVCLAGREYADPVCAVLRERGIECEQPLRGLGLGKRLAWLKENRR